MPIHRKLVERVYATMDAHRWDQIAELCSSDCDVSLAGAPRLRGPAELAALCQGWYAAFPDLHHELVSYVEEGDRAAWEVHVTATHTAPMQTPNGPIPATGRRVSFDLVGMGRFSGGRAASWHAYFDQLGFLQQLGL